MKKPASISRLLAIYLVCTGAFVLLTMAGCSSSLTASINEPTTATSSTAPTAAPTATPLATTTTTPVLVTATPPAPAPTDTPTPTSIPLPTALATLPAPIANTLLLYTTPVDDPSGQAYWAFRTLPPLPGPDPAAFDTLYGSNQGEGPARYFRDFRPWHSPDNHTSNMDWVAERGWKATTWSYQGHVKFHAWFDIPSENDPECDAVTASF